MQGSITGYPASLIAGLILVGIALVITAAPAVVSAAYRRSWLSNVRRNWKWLLTTVGLVLIAQPGVRDLGDLTVGQQVVFKGLGALLLMCVVVPGLVHLRTNHPDVWDEVGKSHGTDISSGARWLILRYAVVMGLVLAGPMGLLVIMFKQWGS